MRHLALMALAVGLWSGLPSAATGATLPPGFTDTLVTSGLSAPTAMALAPDGRIFVAEQPGTLRVIDNGVLNATPFVTLSVDSSGERGLLGVAFDPDFADADHHFVYVYYTVPGSPAHNRVSRFTAAGDVAEEGSEVPILDLPGLSSFSGHNGGAIHFGLDGKLYVAVGDNADPNAAPQSLENLLGKMLRINPDGTIPEDNPFFNTASGQNRTIWALGLRNPYTFAVQPGTGRLFINDVGAGAWEEIDDGLAGSNYGWPVREGFCAGGSTTDCGPPPSGMSNPIFAYGHGSGPTLGCAIVGAAFYNPATVQFPTDYVGDYFFADACSGWIRRLDPATGTPTDFASGTAFPLDLAVANDGSLYYLARGCCGSGDVYRVTSIPTSILVHSFTARRSGAGVVLRWRAARDANVLGFNVYRGGQARHFRLNRNLMPYTAGSTYAFLDRLGSGSSRYWLQAVHADGTGSWYSAVARRG